MNSNKKNAHIERNKRRMVKGKCGIYQIKSKFRHSLIPKKDDEKKISKHHIQSNDKREIECKITSENQCEFNLLADRLVTLEVY